jgi:recyclin-1
MADQSTWWVEILVAILDYLPIVDQMRFARASRRMREMVYDDTRWVSRLKSMGCWDELEARQRFEASMRKRREEAAAAAAAAQKVHGAGPNSTSPTAKRMTLFDASTEEQRRARASSDLKDGFETMSLQPSAKDPTSDPTAYLEVFKNVKSIRGGARQEFGKIYGALAPFYYDLVRAKSHADPVLFKAFRDPEKQAQMLANLHRFSRSDWSDGCQAHVEKVASMIGIFESAVLREFEQGYEFWDVDGRMKRYAHVLYMLNSSRSGIDLFIQKHPIFADRDLQANPIECLNRASESDISTEPSHDFFEMLLTKVNDQADVIERIFPQASLVFWAFVEKVRDDMISEYTTPLFDEAHDRSIAQYVKAVSGVFEQTLLFFSSLVPPKGSNEDLREKAKQLALSVFEPHLDLYLQEELDHFTKHVETDPQRSRTF